MVASFTASNIKSVNYETISLNINQGGGRETFQWLYFTFGEYGPRDGT